MRDFVVHDDEEAEENIEDEEDNVIFEDYLSLL